MRPARAPFCIAASVLPSASCADSRAAESDDAIAALFRAQSDSGAAAWNRGDLVAFGAPYADSVVIVYPEGPVRGKANVERRQRETAGWNGAAPAEQASIGASEARRLGPRAALQTVEIVLRAAGGAERRLWATVVWQRTDGGWRVTHEQSF